MEERARVSGGGHGERSGGRTVGKDGIDRRTALKATAGGALGVSLAGCLDVYGVTASSEDVGPIRIGVLAPDPNRNPIGISMKVGAELAAQALNEGEGVEVGEEAEAGVHGREIEVVEGDTKGRPLEARREYHRLLLEERVDATVGVYDSTALDHLVEDIARQQTVHITSGATSEKPTNAIREDYDRYKYHFRTMTNSTQLVQNQLQFAAMMFPRFGWDSVAVITEDYQWADGLLEAFQAGLPQAGVDVVYGEQYPAETDDFSEMYSDIESAGADAMYVGMAHTGDDAIIDYATNRPSLGFSGIHVPMQIPQYYDMVGGACRYGVSSSSAVPGVELTKRTQPFLEEFRQAAGTDPMFTGYLTYNAVLAYGFAARNASNPNDQDEVVEELEAIEFPSTSGPFQFQGPDDQFPHDSPWSPGGDYVGSVYFQWQEDEDGNGVQEVIFPESLATGEYEAPPWI